VNPELTRCLSAVHTTVPATHCVVAVGGCRMAAPGRMLPKCRGHQWAAASLY
jgi:hypothetical protein